MTRLSLLLGSVAALAAVPAQARDTAKSVVPYVEAGQVLTTDGNDTVTYTSVAVGVDASVQTHRVSVQASYRYEHRFDWDGGSEGVHSGLAQAAVRITPALQFEAGALATRARADIRGDAFGLGLNGGNVTSIYSVYAGPTFATRYDGITINAAYRFGYTKVEAPGFTGVPAGQQRLDYYDSSTNHMAVLSVGTAAGEYLPVGLTASGAWSREEMSQLDQRYDGKYVRLDAVLPVTPVLALVAGVGAEDIQISSRDALLDGAGDPVTDGNGRFVTDPASPRRIAYDTDGLFWDAGVIWRPSRRTTLEARIGRRYDSMTYIGSFSYQINQGSGLQIGVYDQVDSVGRGLSRTLAELPGQFNTRPDPFGDQFGGCVFGRTGDNSGGCLTPVLGALTTAQFRARGVDAVYAMNLGRTTIGLGGGYVHREFLTPGASPAMNLSGTIDQIWYAQAFATRELSPRSSVTGNLFFNHYDSGLNAAPDVTGGGATGTYSYSFGRLGASASLGVYAFDQGGIQTDWSAQAMVGARYSFW